MPDSKVRISVRNLFKVFGPAPETVVPHLHDGICKAEVQEKFDHVLGLNNINVDMRDGEITVIMGLSGSGKSTLIRHLNRLIEPTIGEVIVDGENVLEYNEAQLKAMRQTKMSMVFQKFALFPHRTVLENTVLAPDIRGENAKEAEQLGRKWLDRVGLAGFEDSYPHELSGGMQQRVGLARALTSNAEIMLMDEAFSALDPLIRTSMQDLLLELQQELHKTIIFITHDLDEALKLADHLVILKDGYVVQQGEPQHILLNPSDPYIEEFVADINRARVLRARSIMNPPNQQPADYEAEVTRSTTLEQLISMADGEPDRTFAVTNGDKIVGEVEMTDVFKALVRREVTDQPESTK